MPDNASSPFRELYELYRITYLVYLAGDELRAVQWDHPLLRFLNQLDDALLGREFLRMFANDDGMDPSVSAAKQALTRYHAALIQARFAMSNAE